MTGRIFTSDHRTYDLPELLSWEVVHTGSVPCDSFSVTFLYDRSMAEALRLAAGFTAGIAGAAVSAMLLVRKNPMELLQMRE